MLHPVEIYDYLCLARGRLFDWIRPLDAAAWRAEGPGGARSLAAVLTHTMVSEWYYRLRMEQAVVPPEEQWPIREEAPPAADELERLWTRQAAGTRAALEAIPDWAAPIEYPVTEDDGRRTLITTSAERIFTQLAFHEVHHRSQAMIRLRQLGVRLDDLDFNALTYTRTPLA